MLGWVTRFIDKTKDRWEEDKKGRDRERKMTLEMWKGLTMEEKVDIIVSDKVQEELLGDEIWRRIRNQRGENAQKSLVRDGTLVEHKDRDLEATMP